MSDIPDPISHATPPSLSRQHSVDTQAHHDALQQLWAQIDGLAPKLFVSPVTAGSEQLAEDDYLQRQELAISHARRLADHYSSDDRGQALLDLAAQLDELRRTDGFPRPADDIAEIKIIDKAIEFAIAKDSGTPQRGRRASDANETTLGFIDLACTLEVPVRLVLDDRLPSFLANAVAGDPIDDSLNLARIQSATAEQPNWRIETQRVTAWFDVRVGSTPIGQLIRELKTIRELGPEGLMLFVVVEELDKLELEMLQHEGFNALTRDPETSAWKAAAYKDMP